MGRLRASKARLCGSLGSAEQSARAQADISDIYLLAKKTTGVFVNIALQEPFGLTLIEAAVHGAPIVATTHGGPVDIIKTLKARAPLVYLSGLPYPHPPLPPPTSLLSCTPGTWSMRRP